MGFQTPSNSKIPSLQFYTSLFSSEEKHLYLLSLQAVFLGSDFKFWVPKGELSFFLLIVN